MSQGSLWIVRSSAAGSTGVLLLVIIRFVVKKKNKNNWIYRAYVWAGKHYSANYLYHYDPSGIYNDICHHSS